MITTIVFVTLLVQAKIDGIPVTVGQSVGPAAASLMKAKHPVCFSKAYWVVLPPSTSDLDQVRTENLVCHGKDGQIDAFEANKRAIGVVEIQEDKVSSISSLFESQTESDANLVFRITAAIRRVQARGACVPATQVLKEESSALDSSIRSGGGFVVSCGNYSFTAKILEYRTVTGQAIGRVVKLIENAVAP